MRVLVFGAGAVGQGVGGLLAAAGRPTTLLLRDRHRHALAERGLTVTGIFGERFVGGDALGLVTDPADLQPGEYDVILVCVKSYDTPAAAEAVAGLLGPRTVVVSMQNGYGNVELLAERLGRQRVLCARVITGFEIPRPGEILITVHADDVHVGSFYQPGHPMAAALAAALSEAGLPTVAVDTVEADLWGKILYNCALNPLGAILGVHYGALGDAADSRAVMDAVIDECFDVIAAHGFPCPWPTAAAFREVFYGRQVPATYDHHPSMLQDLQAGKRTEIDALNGAIVRLAAEKGLSADVNQTLVRIVHFLEARRAAARP